MCAWQALFRTLSIDVEAIPTVPVPRRRRLALQQSERSARRLEEISRSPDKVAAERGFGTAEALERCFPRKLGVRSSDSLFKKFGVERIQLRLSMTSPDRGFRGPGGKVPIKLGSQFPQRLIGRLASNVCHHDEAKICPWPERRRREI